MHRKKISVEKSCGIIVYRLENGERQYLLLHYPGGHWDFPKGHVEKRDKSEIDTARRELFEETGIKDVDIGPDYKNSMYYEFRRGRKEIVKKTVIYFLAEAGEKEVKISFEHQNYVWLPYNEALERLTFDNAKDLLKIADEHSKISE